MKDSTMIGPLTGDLLNVTCGRRRGTLRRADYPLLLEQEGFRGIRNVCSSIGGWCLRSLAWGVRYI